MTSGKIVQAIARCEPMLAAQSMVFETSGLDYLSIALRKS